MAQSVIGALRVNLGLDSAQFQRGMTNAQKSMQNARRQFRRIATAAGVVATALGGMTIATAKSAQEISRLSKVANTTPRTLQRWAAATNTVGINQEKLSDILKDVNDRVGDFLTTGGGPMADFFEKIAPQVGVTAEQFRDLSGPQALQLYVSSLEAANLSQAEMTFFLEAMASDATALIPLLRNNGQEMRRLADEADRLGTVLDNKAVAALAEANIAFENATSAVSGLGKQISATFAPALQKVSEYIANGVAGLSMLVRALRESGGAMAVLKSVAVEVFERIVMSFRTVPLAIRIGSNAMTSFFLANLAKMARAFVDFTADVADGLNAVFGTSLTPLGGSMASSIEATAESARAASAAARGEMSNLTDAISSPLQSLQDFKDVLYGAREESDAAAVSLANLSGAVGVGGADGGGGGLASAASQAADATAALSDSIADVEFDPMVQGLTSISDGMIDAIATGQDLLSSFVKMIQQMALEAIKADIGGLIGGMFGGPGVQGGGAGILGLFGGARAMGGPVKAGVPYLVNENTPNSEIIVPSSSGAVLNVPQAQAAMAKGMNGGGGETNVSVKPNIINVFDPSIVGDYLNTPAGESAVVNIMRRNG